MNISLYKTNSENNVVYKTLTDSISLPDCYLKENTSVISPVIFIQTTLDLTSYNYAYISLFGDRYYYITDITSVRNGLWQLNLKVDVLMTYKSYFNKFDIIGGRTSTSNNRYIKDSQNILLSKERVFCMKFPNEKFTKNMCFILTTVGVGDE